MKIGPNFFLLYFINKIIFNFGTFVANKKGMTTNFFSPLSFVSVFGSGIQDPRSGIQDPGSVIQDPGSVMGKNQGQGSGINIPDPQHWRDINSNKKDRDNASQ